MLAFDHIGIAVEELAPSRKLFENTLGLSSDDSELELPGRDTLVQFLSLPRSGPLQAKPAFELLAPTDPRNLDNPLGRFLARRGSRIHHICLATDDIVGTLAHLRRAGVRLVDEEPWLSPHGWAAYLHPGSMLGVTVELREHVG